MATLTSWLTIHLMKGVMMHIIGQEQHFFGLLQCTLISILLYLSHLLQNKTLHLPQILGQTYIPEQTVHTQIRSSLKMVYAVWHLICILTCIWMYWWNMLITFQTIMSIIFGVQIFMNEKIRNNIILKTEQNSSQAYHKKRQNQNLEDKHCIFRWGG